MTTEWLYKTLSAVAACMLLSGCPDDGADSGDDNADQATEDEDSSDGSDTGETGDSSGTDESETEGESTDTDESGTAEESTEESTDTEESGETGDPGNCDMAFESCSALQAAFADETLAVRSCSQPEDCGQVLQGTSCGCTRDWVARTDADTACFYELIDQAGPLACDLGLGSSCDCPPTDGFDCVQGICTWNYL